MSEQHCPENTCHGCYGCECLDNPYCFTCNDRRETRKIERERILANILAAYPDEEVRTYRSTIIQVIEANK